MNILVFYMVMGFFPDGVNGSYLTTAIPDFKVGHPQGLHGGDSPLTTSQTMSPVCGVRG